MHLQSVVFCILYVILWCNGKSIPEDLQWNNVDHTNMIAKGPLRNKTIDHCNMDAKGVLKGALHLKTINGDILMERDMLLTKEQYYSLYEQTTSNRLIRSKRKATKVFNYWTNGEIPYRFEQGKFSKYKTLLMRQAMTEWERYTCLRFKEATPFDHNVIVFKDRKGCSSYVGMKGGEQDVSISTSGCTSLATYLHELGHVIGLVHEHQRPDRDEFVTIIEDNVKNGTHYNLKKLTPEQVDTMGVPYDLYSIMHYEDTAFAKYKGFKTICVNNERNQGIIGVSRKRRLTIRDIQIVKKMYNCFGRL